MNEKKQGWKDDVKQGKNNRKEEERNEEQQWNREEVQGEDVKEGGGAGGKRGTLMTQTTDRADRREDSQRSTEDTGDTKQPETETKDRAEGEGTDGAEERAKKGLHTPETPETQIPVQTTTDTTTEKSDTQKVIDFMDAEPPLAACEPSDCLSQTVSEKDADPSHVNKGCEIRREVHTLCSDEHQSVSHGPNSVIQEVQHLSHDEVQIFAESLTQMPSPVHHVFKKTTEEKPSDSIPTEVSEPLKHTCECDTHVNNECALVRTMVKPQALPQSQEISEQECAQLKSLVTDDGDSSVYKKREGRSNADTRENDPCETAQVCVDITVDTVDLESAVETGSCQEHMKNEDAGDANTTKNETDLKLSVHLSHEDDASPETGREKCYEQCPADEMLLDDNHEWSLPSNKTYRLSFDWASVQRKTVSSRTQSDVSVLHQFVQVV